MSCVPPRPVFFQVPKEMDVHIFICDQSYMYRGKYSECAAVSKEKLPRKNVSRCWNCKNNKRSNALQLYECPTEQQRKNVSEVLVQGKEYGKENMPTHNISMQRDTCQGSSMNYSIFSNCKVNISPQQFNVNITPATTTPSPDYDVQHLEGI